VSLVEVLVAEVVALVVLGLMLSSSALSVAQWAAVRRADQAVAMALAQRANLSRQILQARPVVAASMAGRFPEGAAWQSRLDPRAVELAGSLRSRTLWTYRLESAGAVTYTFAFEERLAP